MNENDSTEELDEKIFLLEQNFLRELKRIAEQRAKLENQTVMPDKHDLLTGNNYVSNVVHKTVSLRLEPSLGEKLAKSRETADDLEDKLQKSRIAFEDKLKTVDRMKTELNRRENLFASSVQQIEAYLRAVFYMQQEADNMYQSLRSTSEDQHSTIKRLGDKATTWQHKKDSLAKALRIFEASKQHLEKLISDLPEYNSIKDLVDYCLVLERLQEELLAEESQRSEDDDLVDKQKVAEFERHAPAALVSKESTLLALRSKLKNLKVDITQLEEQIDATTLDRVKDDAARYQLQNWIKKMYLTSVEFRPPEKIAVNTLNMLNGIKDFIADALEIAQRLRTEVIG